MPQDRSSTDQPQAIPLAVLRGKFPITERINYLNHAATGPISRDVQAAITRQTDIHVPHHETATQRFEPVSSVGECEGAFRASPHYYNSEDEIDALVQTLTSPKPTL